MIDTNCRNCGAPIENGKCRYCGTRNTFSSNYRKPASNAPVNLTKVAIGAFVLIALSSNILKKRQKKTIKK